MCPATCAVINFSSILCHSESAWRWSAQRHLLKWYCHLGLLFQSLSGTNFPPCSVMHWFAFLSTLGCALFYMKMCLSACSGCRMALRVKRKPCKCLLSNCWVRDQFMDILLDSASWGLTRIRCWRFGLDSTWLWKFQQLERSSSYNWRCFL